MDRRGHTTSLAIDGLDIRKIVLFCISDYRLSRALRLKYKHGPSFEPSATKIVKHEHEIWGD